jgi:hypothetical protein
VGRNDDGVDHGLGTGGVASLASDRDREAVRGGHHGSGSQADAARVSLPRYMQGKGSFDAVQDAGIDHGHGAALLAVLLGGLEHQPDVARQRIAALVE